MRPSAHPEQYLISYRTYENPQIIIYFSVSIKALIQKEVSLRACRAPFVFYILPFKSLKIRNGSKALVRNYMVAVRIK